MTTYYLNGTAITEGADFILNGFTYPYEWLENTTPSIRASLGIEATGDINYNEKYYYNLGTERPLQDSEAVDDNGDPVYLQVFDPSAGENGEGAMVNTNTRAINRGLKYTCTSEVKLTTNNLLKPTDYYILRNAVEELEIPSSISTYRAAVVAEQNRVVTAIADVTTVEELIEVVASIAWPEAE